MPFFKNVRLPSLFFAYAWLLLTAGVILISIAGYQYFGLTRPKQIASNGQDQAAADNPGSSFAEGSQMRGVETVVEHDDARPVIVAEFLKRHGSPMTPHDSYGRKLVEIADRYNLDFRLLPAIAMRESNLCKNTHSQAPHNCLGFGIHERGTLDFESYEAGFERAARELRAHYVDGGRITTEQVGQKYAASPTWADGVNQFMAEMRYDDRQLGRELKEDDTSVLEFAQ